MRPIQKTATTSATAATSNDFTTPPKDKDKDHDHRLGLVESLSLDGAGFGLRYRAPKSGLYIEPGAFETFHYIPAASDDPMGSYLGVDFSDTASLSVISSDPELIADDFFDRLDSNPFRCRIGFQGDILPKKVIGPTFDLSFDPVQTGIAAVRGGEMFSYEFQQGEDAIEPLKPYLGSNIDSQENSAKTVGAITAGTLTGVAGLAQSVSVGVGFHIHPEKPLELGMTVGTTGLNVYRAVRNYSEHQDTTQAVLTATEIKAAAIWRF